MKALSIQQPWSWLIVNGHKDIENRNWPTTLRGRIYVHAGLRQDYDAYDGDVVHRRLEPYIWNKIPWEAIAEWGELPITTHLGAIVGEVDIVDSVSISDSQWFEGPYGFILANPLAYETPIPCKGRLGFFDPVLPEPVGERE